MEVTLVCDKVLKSFVVCLRRDEDRGACHRQILGLLVMACHTLTTAESKCLKESPDIHEEQKAISILSLCP